MKIVEISITLEELQQALNDWAYKNATSQPEFINVESHGQTRIRVELRPGGMVSASDFSHRAGV